MARGRDPEFLEPAWWNSVIRDAFAVIDPILEELARKLIGKGYVIGQQPMTWEKFLELAQAQGEAYAGEVLRRMLLNPSTSKDAAKLFEKALEEIARRNVERQPGALRYAGQAYQGV